MSVAKIETVKYAFLQIDFYKNTALFLQRVPNDILVIPPKLVTKLNTLYKILIQHLIT